MHYKLQSLSATHKPFYTIGVSSNIPILDFIGAKDEGGGDDNFTGAIRRANLQPNHHNQQTNIQHLHFYRQDALPVAQPTVSRALKEDSPLIITAQN